MYLVLMLLITVSKATRGSYK